MLFGERIRFMFYAVMATLCSPALLLIAFCRRITFRKSDSPRILIIPIMTRVGDLVCSTPVYREIKNRFPTSFLAVAVAKKAAGILRHNPRVDEFININDLPFKGFWGRGRFYKYIFSKKFDYAIALTNDARNNLMTIASGAPFRVKTVIKGRTMTEWITDAFNSHRFVYTPGTFLQDHYMRLLAPMDITWTAPVKEMYTCNTGEKRADVFFAAVPPGIRVGITVSAGNKIKEWPLERFAALADALIERYEATIIFIDSPDNKSRVDTVIGKMKHKGVFVALDWGLEEIPSLVKRLSAFIAVDTGLIYVAHAFGVPLLDIVGPVDPNEQPPKDERSIQVLPTAGITPSSTVLGGQVRDDHAKAVESIEVAHVLRAFAELCRGNGIMHKG